VVLLLPEVVEHPLSRPCAADPFGGAAPKTEALEEARRGSNNNNKAPGI